jgi:hypothetical protein
MASSDQIVTNWFRITGFVLTSLVAVYLIAHNCIPGSEIVKLSKQELTDVNLIVFGSDNDAAIGGSSDTTQTAIVAASKRNFSLRKAAVYRFLFSTRKPVDEKDSITFVKYFNGFEPQQFVTVMSNYPIRSQSYFWLTAPGIYLEVIFWSLFGLLASLFYYVSEAIRKGEYNTKEVNVHIAKFFYTPFSALIIFFSINALTKTGDIVITEFSNSSIVLSFILGFFSGRTVELLGKIKDLILPATKPGTDEPTNQRSDTQSPVTEATTFSSLPLTKQDELIQEYIEEFYEELKQTHPNLTGINSQRKKIGGFPSNLMSIGFQVLKKDNNVQPQFDKVIEYKGFHIPTDVHEHDVTQPISTAVPLESGVSRVGMTAFGTLGIPVTDTYGNSLVMSCYHVLFDQELAAGILETMASDNINNRDVLSPCFAEGGTIADNVGTITEGKINDWLDIGVFKPNPSHPLELQFSKLPGLHGIYQLTRDDENKAFVQYWGNGMKRVCALKVENIFSNQWISYVINGLPTQKFIRGLIQLEGIVQKGDSGAPVFDGAGAYVGTIVGADNKSTYLISARSIILKTNYTIKTI